MKEIIAEWTGEAPARFHTPFDTGSNPVSAIDNKAVGLVLLALCQDPPLVFYK